MDDDTVLAAARSDPTGLVRALDRTTIDEVQRVPDLLRAIKKSVDDDRRAGRFLLTGSANILTLPQVSESLAGRMEVKAGATVNTGDFKGLGKLEDACGDNFKLGVVLYDGGRTVPFGDHLVAVPISCLWG